jgi:hypothetical protein
MRKSAKEFLKNTLKVMRKQCFMDEQHFYLTLLAVLLGDQCSKTKIWSTQKKIKELDNRRTALSRGLDAFYRSWNSLRNTKILLVFSIVYFSNFLLSTEIHIQIQVALHDCLPRSRLLGDEDTPSEIVYGEEKNISYWADRAARAG